MTVSIHNRTLYSVLLFLVSTQINATAEPLLHDDFLGISETMINGRRFFDTDEGVRWVQSGGGNGRIEAEDGAVRIVNTGGGFATFFELDAIDDAVVERQRDWSIRTRMIMQAGADITGTGTTSLDYGALSGEDLALAAGNQFNFGLSQRLDPIFGTEMYVQLNAFDDTLIAYAWPTDDDSDVSSASWSKVINPSRPLLWSFKADATFYDVTVSTTRLPLPVTRADFNDDGVLTAEDLDLLSQAIRDGANDTRFDLTGEGRVRSDDYARWVKDWKVTSIGDANLDGEFQSNDLIAVFQSAKYELDVDATWTEGDWNGDRRFDSGDLVAAFADNGYEANTGSEISVVPVPEPNGALLVSIGIAAGFLCILRYGGDKRRC